MLIYELIMLILLFIGFILVYLFAITSIIIGYQETDVEDLIIGIFVFIVMTTCLILVIDVGFLNQMIYKSIISWLGSEI